MFLSLEIQMGLRDSRDPLPKEGHRPAKIDQDGAPQAPGGSTED